MLQNLNANVMFRGTTPYWHLPCITLQSSPLPAIHGLACFHVLFQLFQLFQLSMDLLAYTYLHKRVIIVFVFCCFCGDGKDKGCGNNGTDLPCL